MNTYVIDKINATNQKYLSALVGRQIPARLEEQLNNMDWSNLDAIHNKEQKRGQFAPLGAMELPEIEAKKTEFKPLVLRRFEAAK